MPVDAVRRRLSQRVRTLLTGPSIPVPRTRTRTGPSDDGLRLLGPAGVLRQQSPTTCGSASLVVARMLLHPDEAARMVDGDAATVRERFRVAERQTHRRTNAWRTAGRWQVPWPRALGTPPWGARRELESIAGGAWRVRAVHPASAQDRGAAFDELSAAVSPSRPVLLYVGDRVLPRHVVLVVGARAGAVRVWEPSRGRCLEIGRGAFVAGALAVAGWDRPWAVVVPR